jgi:hypothetical protein
VIVYGHFGCFRKKIFPFCSQEIGVSKLFGSSIYWEHLLSFLKRGRPETSFSPNSWRALQRYEIIGQHKISLGKIHLKAIYPQLEERDKFSNW